jgi:hypothetical protein
MSIESRTVFLRKDEALLREEAGRERLASWVRLLIAGAAFFIFMSELLLGASTLALFTFRTLAATALGVWSGLYLFGYSKPFIGRIYPFFLTLLDIAVISAVLWSYSLWPRSSPLMG